jgi:phosphoribosylamine--glycine ligase/phosphoribosylformylglycinamidine cyclo-ligase
VAAIDGVGTKLMVAQIMNKHDTVGIDLVAMNVNDLLAGGAEPLMFLDYYGCSKLNTANAVAFVKGVAAGCRLSKGALVGGETAEMPGMYQKDDYDAAGCSIGIMREEDRLPKKEAMVEGDILLGIASAGVHSNGFSLVRRIIERAGVSYHEPAPWNKDEILGLSLLTPTKIYVQSVLPLIKKHLILGLAHITGGGLTENIPRALPSHLAAEVDVSTWQVPPVFKYLKAAGNVSATEMGRTFNNGVGMVTIVSKENAQQATSELEAAGEKVFTIGKLVPRATEGCILKNLQAWD